MYRSWKNYNWKKRAICGAVLLSVLTLGACGPKAGASGAAAAAREETVPEESAGDTAPVEGSAGDSASMEGSTGDSAPMEGSTGAPSSVGGSTGAPAAEENTADAPSVEKETSQPSAPGLVNPIQEVEGSSSFSRLGISLELPQNPDWIRDPACSILGGKVAQIRFYDMMAESDAIVRAADESEEDISGIYYVFDDTQKQSWFTMTEDGQRIEISLRVTVENSDVPGALATWTFGGNQYCLWEDNVRDTEDAVARMAIEIAKASAEALESTGE